MNSKAGAPVSVREKDNFKKMKSVALKAYPRSQVRRGGVKKLRGAGRVPATIYGRQAKPQNLEISAKEISDLIHHSVSENPLAGSGLST